MTFYDSLNIGEKAQKDFAKILLDTENVVKLEFAQGKFPDWDIKITTPKWEKTYEVKIDTISRNTGSFCVEHKYKGKASWIFASKADYVAYNIADEWWLAERSELVLRLPETERERELNWWDGNYSSLRIFSWDKLPDLFTKVKVNGEAWEADAETGESYSG